MPYYKNSRQFKKQQNKIQKSIDKSVPIENDVDIPVIQAAERQRNYINSLPDTNEAIGVAVHSIINRRTSSTYLGDVRDYTDPNLENREKTVELARKLRAVEGICSSVIELLIDFGVTKGRFVCDNEELESLLNRWSAFVNSPNLLKKEKGVVYPSPGIRSLFRKVFDDFLTDGDAIFTLFWEKGVKIDPSMDKIAYFLPTKIKALDTLMVDADKDLAKLGVEQLELKIDDKLKKKILEPTSDADKVLSKNIPPEWVKALRSNQKIYLDSNVTYHLKRNPKDYKPWGESLLIKAFSAVANKRRLQAVDEATIDGLINRLTVFKLGLEDETKNKLYHKVSPQRVQALLDLVTNPKRVNAIVWPGPDLTIDDIGPDGKILEFVDKYKQVDIDILRALHVSPLLIDGGSSGQAVRDWAAFLSTEVGLDAIRGEFESVLTQIAKEVAIANKLDFQRLYYAFDTQLLKDEKRIRNFALKVYELGGISIKTFVETMGYNFDTEKALKEKEEAEGMNETFINKALPYQGNSVSPDGRPPDTKNDDLGKPKSDKTTDMNNQSASVGGLEVYFQLYMSAFDTLKKELRTRRTHCDLANNPRDLQIALISGFSIFRQLVDSEITHYFYDNNHRVGEHQEILIELLKWNEQYLDKFYTQLESELVSTYEDPNKFDSILDSLTYRVYQYAKESYVKAHWTSRFLKAKEEGCTICVWESHEGATCEFAKENHGKEFSITSISPIFPLHPNCKCNLTFK